MLTNTHTYLKEDDVIKHEKESGQKTGIFIIKLAWWVEPFQKTQEGGTMQVKCNPVGEKKWGEENKHIAS